MKLDILVIVAHPDDAELGCAGSLYIAKKNGYKTGILNLTQGELGTNGTPEIRRQEAEKAAKLLGLDFMEILNLGDGIFRETPEAISQVIRYIRILKPTIIITNARTDRHPDHSRAYSLVKNACFYSGLLKWKTSYNGKEQEPYRPKIILSMIQDYYIKPDFVVDISEVFPKRIEIIKAYFSQFTGRETPISRSDFFQFIEARAREMGRRIFKEFGEGFLFEKVVSNDDLLLLGRIFSYS